MTTVHTFSYRNKPYAGTLEVTNNDGSVTNITTHQTYLHDYTNYTNLMALKDKYIATRQEYTPDIKKTAFKFKAIIVGDSGSGKSCLLLRENRKDIKNLPQVLKLMQTTIGVDFINTYYSCPNENKPNDIIQMEIFDTAGQDRFRNITRNFMRASNIVLLAFDISSRTSFEKLNEYWVHQIDRNTFDPIIILVACKTDLRHLSVVYEEDVRRFCKQYDIKYYVEVSSLTDPNEKFNTIFGIISCLVRNKFKGWQDCVSKEHIIHLANEIKKKEEPKCCLSK